MSEKVEVNTNSIRKILKKYNPANSIAEYIWNGFDAGANKVELFYEANSIGYISQILIKDNGRGINFIELKYKFKPFFDSEKTIEINKPKYTSAYHGKNGVGRLTFFTFV